MGQIELPLGCLPWRKVVKVLSHHVIMPGNQFGAGRGLSWGASLGEWAEPPGNLSGSGQDFEDKIPSYFQGELLQMLFSSGSSHIHRPISNFLPNIPPPQEKISVILWGIEWMKIHLTEADKWA